MLLELTCHVEGLAFFFFLVFKFKESLGDFISIWIFFDKYRIAPLLGLETEVQPLPETEFCWSEAYRF